MKTILKCYVDILFVLFFPINNFKFLFSIFFIENQKDKLGILGLFSILMTTLSKKNKKKTLIRNNIIHKFKSVKYYIVLKKCFVQK